MFGRTFEILRASFRDDSATKIPTNDHPKNSTIRTRSENASKFRPQIPNLWILDSLRTAEASITWSDLTICYMVRSDYLSSSQIRPSVTQSDLTTCHMVKSTHLPQGQI